MDAKQRSTRLDQLRAMVEGQPEAELRTQFAAVVDEIAKLEGESGAQKSRKGTTGSDRKKRGGHDREG